MNKYSSVKEQLDYLKDINLKITDEVALENFLWDVPFQRSINQLKFYYSKSDAEYREATCFYRKDSQDLIAQYESLLSDSHKILNNALIFENKIKNALFFDLLEVYKCDETLYSSLIVSILQKTKKARQFAFPDLAESDNQSIQELYKEKIYKIINASSLKEIRDIIEELYCSCVKLENLYNVVDRSIETTNKMMDSSKKEHANMLSNNHEMTIEEKNDIVLLVKSDFASIFSEALINDIYPIEVINNLTTRLISNVSKSKIKKFFRENEEVLSEFKNQVNTDQLKSRVKKQIEVNESFNTLVKLFVENNCREIYKILALSNSKTECDVVSYRNRMPNSKEVSYYILIKKLAMVSSFRNTISHGNTLLITIKPRKDRVYVEAVLKSFLMKSNEQEYIRLLYLEK